MSLRSGTSRPLRRAEYWVFLGAVVFVAICFYGIRAAAVLGLAAVTAVLTDFICLFLRGRSYKVIDLSNAGAAVVMALMFPATVPYSIVILSTVFAVAIGAHVFGYRRSLLFPPAAVGYLFAVICWKDEILQFPEVGRSLSLFGNDVTLVPSLTSIYNEKGDIALLHTDSLEILIGAVAGPMGTGCTLLLALGLIVLLLRRQVNFWSFLGSLMVIVIPIIFGNAGLAILLTNMLLFSMIFLTGDPALMPCRGLMAYFAALLTSVVTGFLIVRFRIEYAPAAALILTCPFWYWLAKLEERIYPQTSGRRTKPLSQEAQPTNPTAKEQNHGS
ncbi:MAG: RnfABCDGE type electron transport complex subunit D [Oscillospiraceae bacterium]|nr:RnfABCDGE type electron transport complex subunit D [Oscillospiraceae bacterium]